VFSFGIFVGQANGPKMENPLDVGLGSHLVFWLYRLRRLYNDALHKPSPHVSCIYMQFGNCLAIFVISQLEP